MEDSSRCSKSEYECINSASSGSSSLGDQILLEKLSDGVASKLNISGVNLSNDTNVEGRLVQECYTEECEEEGDDLSEEAVLVLMGYAKSVPEGEAQKQYSDEMEEKEESEDLSEEFIVEEMDNSEEEIPKHKSGSSTNDTVVLVSALKGSRKKEGNSVKDCRVSWAPGVYDPIPTPPEHFMSNMNEMDGNEQKGKGGAGRNKQKKGGNKRLGQNEGEDIGGKGSKGGKKKGAGKRKDDKQLDKKRSKKHGGNISRNPDYHDY